MKFNIPIVFQIKADSVEEAENIAMRFAEDGVEVAINHVPERYKALRGYGVGQSMTRIRKDQA